MNESEPKWYNKTWLVIMLCIVFFPVGLYAVWKNNQLGKGWKISITILMILLIIAGANSENERTTEITTTEDVAEPAAPGTKPYDWQYTEKVDPMTSATTYHASLLSTTTLNFEFPYAGGSQAWLMVRKSNGENEVMLKVSKGQFIASFENQTMRIRFDQEQPVTVNYSSAADGSSDIVFLSQPYMIINKLKTAHKVVVESQFYQEGVRHIDFVSGNFIWNH